jgi:predicted amidophosphoribosyltransferase
MKGICDHCHNFKLVHRHRKTQQNLCVICYRKYFSPKKKCSKCGEVRPVAGRIGLAPICANCKNKNKIGICVHCDEKKIIQAHGRCYRCYQEKRRMKKRGEIQVKKIYKFKTA